MTLLFSLQVILVILDPLEQQEQQVFKDQLDQREHLVALERQDPLDPLVQVELQESRVNLRIIVIFPRVKKLSTDFHKPENDSRLFISIRIINRY